MDSEEIQMAKAMAVLLHINTDGMSDEEIMNAVTKKIEETIPEEIREKMRPKCRRSDFDGVPALEVPFDFGTVKIPIGHLGFLYSLLAGLSNMCIRAYEKNERGVQDKYKSHREMCGMFIKQMLDAIDSYIDETEGFEEELAASDSVLGVVPAKKSNTHNPMFG